MIQIEGLHTASEETCSQEGKLCNLIQAINHAFTPLPNIKKQGNFQSNYVTFK